MRSLLSQLNIRQLIIYFIASWLFMYATHTLTTLYDFTFLYKDSALQNRELFKERFVTDLFIINMGGYPGLIIAYIIAWQITTKRNWFWANPVIVFLVVFILYFFNLLGWKVLGQYVLAPGRLFSDQYNIAGLIADCIIMLALGSFLFFNKRITQYIDKGVKKDNGNLKIAEVKK